MASYPPPQRSSGLYFAFGSNLHLGQMAKRCPESRYVGVARLHDWRFQINNRRYANVVPSAGSCVEGLVYRLSLTDEANLDKSEGVPTAYQKWTLDVELFTTPIEHVARAVPELAKELDNSGVFQHNSLPLRGQHTQVLVYLSPKHVQEGKPWDEYINRMNAGIMHARKLGLTDPYIQCCLRPYIQAQPLPSQNPTPARRNSESRHPRRRNSNHTRHSSLEHRHRNTGHNIRLESTGLGFLWPGGGQPTNARTPNAWYNKPDRYNESSRHRNDR